MRTLPRHVLRRARQHRIMAGGNEHVVEYSDVQLGPAVVVGLDEAKGLAASRGEGHEGGIFDERANTHFEPRGSTKWDNVPRGGKRKGDSRSANRTNRTTL